MSVIVKGMKLPKHCLECPLGIPHDHGFYYCPFTGVVCLNICRQADCPLEELKEVENEDTGALSQLPSKEDKEVENERKEDTCYGNS